MNYKELRVMIGKHFSAFLKGWWKALQDLIGSVLVLNTALEHFFE